MAAIKAGYGREELRVPLGKALGGYQVEGRYATGIHDPLYVRVLMLQTGEEIFCIVQMDLLGIDAGFAGRIRKALADAGLPEQNIMAGAIHTHSGPVGTNRGAMGADEFANASADVFDDYDEDLCALFLGAIQKAAHTARSQMEECSFCYGFADSQGVAANRTNTALTADPVLFAMEGTLKSGKRFLVYNFSVHPTIMKPDNTQISADLIGGVAAKLENAEYAFVLFLNGSAGDISTRFTRKAATFEEVDRLSGLLVRDIGLALSHRQAMDDVSLSVSSLQTQMRVKAVDSVAAAQEKLEGYQKELAAAQARGESGLRLYESRAEGALHNLLLSKKFQGLAYIPITIRFFRFGALCFVMFPSECFSALSQPVRKELGPEVIFCTYMNGSQGYIANAAAYEAESYEALSSPYRKGEGEVLLEQIRSDILARKGQ